MFSIFSPQQRGDLIRRGYSRRHFGRLAALAAAGASLPFYNEFALAQRSLSMIPNLPPDAVRINGNENPLGPCSEAAEAAIALVSRCGRYNRQETTSLVKNQAEFDGLKPEYVMPFAGSSDPLHRIVMAYTSPTRSFVVADPGYEAGTRAAEFVGAKVVKVPLRKDYTHDVKAMVQADPNAGVLYICNPNNPTGTVTSINDIEYVLANKPRDSILLLDEAYIHFSHSATMGSALVAADKDLIVIRTFSKLFGLAGLRAGVALGRPDLLEKIQGYGVGAMPATGMAAAAASLKVPNLIPERRTINAQDSRKCLRVDGQETLCVHSLRDQLLPGRRQASRARVHSRDDQGEGGHRAHLGGPAQPCPGHGGNPGRHEQVQDGLREGDELLSRPAGHRSRPCRMRFPHQNRRSPKKFALDLEE